MNRRALQRPAARRDFIQHYVYLAEQASPDVAGRFRISLEATYAALIAMPDMGASRFPPHSRHAAIRLWSVKDFPNYWIAYKRHRQGIAVERVFHTKQDYNRIMQ